MRTLLLVVVLFGCGSTATAPAPVGNTVVKTEFRKSRDGMVREVVALLSAGDANALLALADVEDVVGVECGHRIPRFRERIAVAAVRAKGSAIEVERIDAAPEREARCVTKPGVTVERVKVKIRIGGDPATFAMGLVRAGDRYFLLELPRRIGGGGNEAMAKFIAHTDTICACPDTACITDATEAYGKEMAEWAKANAGKLAESPTEEEKVALEDATKRLTDCATRIAQQAAQQQVP